MSGHSKWATIRRSKAANDAKRGQLFTKLGRAITIAAREGGGDPETNFKLRLAVQKARESNMPMDNVERAIQRGAGGGEDDNYEEIMYEGYGPGGLAILIQVATDNRRRTVAEVRSTLTRAGGSLGATGCVAWQFESKGVILLDAQDKDPEELALLAIDAGAEDVDIDDTDGRVEVRTELTLLQIVKDALENEAPIISAEVSMIPKTVLALDEKDALRSMRLMEQLEELDDVQDVYTNLDISDELIAQMSD
ncbi:MAG: YebC/PmpR family DNA-binding transcriptional regulator [Chloroflexi bacterium]|nr:YebC/PmpR family DNA-binding transcriptional regulator [Chloroflexota bacterium]MBU1751087.1 YebC/PmpR family DNA-binding transcriptional regulator [Chloroflexota bacterium]